MLMHTRKGTTIVTQQEKNYKRNPATDEQFISKALLCSILLLSRKHLQLFATGSFHLSQANFCSIHFLKVQHLPGKIDNKPLPFLKLFSSYNRLSKKSFVRFVCGVEFVARLATSRPKKLAPLAMKLVKLDFAVASMGFSEALSCFSHFSWLK